MQRVLARVQVRQVLLYYAAGSFVGTGKVTSFEEVFCILNYLHTMYLLYKVRPEDFSYS